MRAEEERDRELEAWTRERRSRCWEAQVEAALASVARTAAEDRAAHYTRIVQRIADDMIAQGRTVNENTLAARVRQLTGFALPVEELR